MTVYVSLTSLSVSPFTATLIGLAVCPAMKVSVPDAAT